MRRRSVVHISRASQLEAAHSWWCRRAWLSRLAFAVLFATAALVGRASRLPGTPLALVWPAAAVGFAWLALSWHDRRRRCLDAVALGVAAALVNALTGLAPALAVAFGVANAVQALGTCWTMHRLQPQAWRLRQPSDLTAFVGACLAGSAMSATVGPLALWLGTGVDFWPTAGAWLLRDASSTFVFGALVLRLSAGEVGREHVTLGRSVELASVALLILTGYSVVFGMHRQLPLAFLLVPLSMWVALRFDATIGAAHVLLIGTFVVLETLVGHGPFAVAEPAVRVLLAQSYVTVVGLVAMSLALFRDDREDLLRRVGRARHDAVAQAAMLSTLMDTVDVGVVACDADGRLTVFNRASREFHGMPADPSLDPANWADRYDLFSENGRTRLLMEQVPLLRALQDGSIHDATIVIAPKNGQRRVVRCDGHRLVDSDGTVLGAVVAMKDVTEARQGRRALEDREQRFRAAFHDSPTPIAYVGLTGVVHDSNAALRRFLAVGSNRLTDQQLTTLAHPDDRDTLQQALQGEGTGQNPLEVRMTRADGVHLWCEVATTRSSDQTGQPYLLAQFLDIDARKRHELALEAAARCDPLTGLGNRAALTSRLRVLLGPNAPRPGAMLLYLDLDGFKAVNDTYGHDAGDAVLAEVAVRLQSAVRPEDLVVRLGGDEFVIACSGDKGRLESLVERLEQTVSAPVPYGEWLLSVGVSVGTAAGGPGTDPQQLLEGADRAMYRRKKQRNHHSTGSAPTAPRRATADAQLAVSVATGLADGRFRLVYQPVVDLRTGRTVGAEALLRLTDTRGSAVAPDTFIPVAEAHGHIGALGRWVLAEALTQAQLWKMSLPAGQDFLIAVNLSPLQLHDPGLVDHVRSVLAATGIDPAAVGLEITESRLLPDTPGVHQTLNELQALGVHVGVDDFGTGYANIGYLATFPFDALKIDRRFTSRLVEDSAEGRLADGVFALARATGLITVAEGIETVEQRDAVLDRGCTLGQGFLWARPLSVQALDDRLRRELTDLAGHIPLPRR